MPTMRKLSQAEIQRIETAAPLPEPPSQGAEQSANVPEATYPHVAAWVHGGGWIELGQDDYSRSFIRVLDTGGMIWEGKTRYASLDAAMRDADRALARMEETGEI